MKRRLPDSGPRPDNKQQKMEDLGLNLSSTSDEEPLGGGARARSRSREMASSGDEDTDSEGSRPVFGGVLGLSRPSLQGDSTDQLQKDALSSKYSMYNSVSQKLMAKMGYREGEGLGKFGQGRKEIVETSLQRGRRGLGLKLKGFDGDLDEDWQDESEPGAYERVEWFPECSLEVPHAAELREWMVIGQRKMEIEDETEFCDAKLLSKVLRCKVSIVYTEWV
ncbi:cap-specific mRNA (nucleoside-2'-O-)-methyltransferase 1-like [Heptranchias perlo]|uniref:cap-specific mRNA (nucleoside-2'-O-)-methyltransferase 1-like n=1 Tax=Heptranchias perlo TaxID=212740 RepID=UPI003559C230